MTSERVRESFHAQAEACRSLGSALTADICDILADELDAEQGEVAAKILNWTDDPTNRGDAVALRLCGGLHMLVLNGSDKALAMAYAHANPTPDLLLNAIKTHSDFLLDWLQSPPQTNEVGRSAAIIAAARFVSTLAPLPIRALELGASAGLNLNFHRYHLLSEENLLPSEVALSPEWKGGIPQTKITVASAEGVDLKPADPIRDQLRLLAYCWPDQPDRMTRLRAALAVAKTHKPQVTAGDAASWLPSRLATPQPNHLTLVYHTIAWQYFPAQTQATCESALQSAGANATPETPLAHFSMESDGGKGGVGAAMTLRLWDGEMRRWNLGRVDFHGRWLDWQPEPI